MLNKIKFFISNFKFLYSFLKWLKNNYFNTKIFFLIPKNEINNFNLKKSKYFTFNKKNLNYVILANEKDYIFITDKNISKNQLKAKLNNLLYLIINDGADLAYDGNCPYQSEVMLVHDLKKYSQKFTLELYPYKFFYFYKEFNIKFKSIGINHRKYNFNGSFILPGGGLTIGDSGNVNFRLNFIPDLSNKTFLDIGSEEGYSVFNALKKNAKSAKGVNIHESEEYDYFPRYLVPKRATGRLEKDKEETRNFLKKIYNLENSSRVSFDYKNIYDLGNDKYDFVFCFGVLYHLKNPYLAIENLFNITKETLLLETQGSFAGKNKFSVLLSSEDGFVRHSPEALKFLLLKAGFNSAEVIFSGVNKIKTISNIVLKATKKIKN